MDEAFVLTSIKTHRISAEELLADNFEAHMEFRSEQLITQVRTAMGKDVGEGSSFIAEDEETDDEN